MGIGTALAAMLALAVAITVVVTYLGLRFLHFQHFQQERDLSPGTLFNLLKVAFAVAAGIGAVVALVTTYRRQRVAEFAERRQGLAERRELTRLFNERFATAAGQLGHDNSAVRLAGVYAMAGLADDWPEQRQTCVDVLCAYLRMPYEADPGEEGPVAERLALRAGGEVRHTVIRVIAAHLQPDTRRAATAVSWHGLDFDFTGVVFDGGDFTGAQFDSGLVSFARARFAGGLVNFDRAEFAGGNVRFEHATFASGGVSFTGAAFTSGLVSFKNAEFAGSSVSFDDARFAGGQVSFTAYFGGGQVSFAGASFAGGPVSFDDAKFAGGQVRFTAQFAGGQVSFDNANFAGGQVSFAGAEFSRGRVSFGGADFNGSQVTFGGAAGFTGNPLLNVYPAKFTGGTVDMSRSGGWSSSPPAFPDWAEPPPGLLLPS
jgi:uncharacterized protein YjbI with pentapeptide repeats